VKNLKTGIMQSNYTHEDGTPFTKEEFLQKLKIDKEFNDEFGSKGIDQISELIRQLKDNPDSRRMVVSAWAVHDLPKMVLPPCHYGFQVYTRELSEGERGLLLQPYGLDPLTKEGRDRLWKENNLPTRAISLMWNQRSCDLFLGIPFNIASYGLLLEIIAKAVNMVPDELIGNLGDVHLYSNHIEQAKEQIGREPYPLPTLKHLRNDDKYKLLCEFPLLWDELKISDFEIENYQSHLAIKAPLSN
jgi:thymidylate synthase